MRHPILSFVFCRFRANIFAATLPLVVAVGWHANAVNMCRADEKEASDAAQSRQLASESLTKTLPAPPGSIAKLIADGKVVFDFYDDTQHDYVFTGETTFDFHYEYRCRTRYQVIENPDVQSDSDQASEHRSGRALEVTLDYEEVILKISHRMRLPSGMVGEDFFDQRLVKHEFDHVAISADPRLSSFLVRMLTERNAKLIVPLSHAENKSRDQAMYAKMARQATREETKKVFEDFVAIIRIRYKELDQATRHGIEPLAPETRQRLLSF